MKTNRKKNAAILTQSLGLNYGGIIQNYALQKVLQNFDLDVITINRTLNNPHSELKILGSEYKSLFNRYILRHRKPTFLDHSKIRRHTDKFIKKYIKLSPEIRSTSKLTKYFSRKRFDSVVVGSDQVWRPKYSPEIYDYFLGFLINNSGLKKISYAASFGTEDWEYTAEETNECTGLLTQFDAVSVREDSATILCAQHLNRKDAKLVLDPTLLLSADDYSQLIGAMKKEIGLYTYVLDDAPDKLDFITQCAKELRLPIHTNQANQPVEYFSLKEDINDFVLPPIEGWLQGFRDAEFVITDSFHGTVFSIINRKAFFVLVNSDRGAARFESLLGQLGLGDRLIYEPTNFDFETLTLPIDYNKVVQKLNGLIDESLTFLKQNL